MPTQFDKVMAKLDEVLIEIRSLRKDFSVEMGMEQDLFEDGEYTGEYRAEMKNQTGEDYDVKPRVKEYVPSETRTHVEVRNLDGDIEMVSWEEIDQRIIDAINAHKAITSRNPDALMGPWQLYRDPTGMIRISVDQAVLAYLHKEETYQQPVPRSGNIPRDMDVDQVAREKE